MSKRTARRGAVRRVGLVAAAMAILMLSAIQGERAHALSPINPASVPAAKESSDGLAIQVRHGGHRGGGFHGGGFRGHAFHGGGFRGHTFHGGGFRHHRGFAFHRGFHHRGFAFRHHRFHHRAFIFSPVYYSSYPYCRVIWTYYGPRRICPWRNWRYRYYW